MFVSQTFPAEVLEEIKSGEESRNLNLQELGVDHY